MTDLDALERDLLASIAAGPDDAALEAARIHALGKKGIVSELLKGLGAMSPEARKEQGPRLNGLKDRVAAAIADRKAGLSEAELARRLEAERVDITLPARGVGVARTRAASIRSASDGRDRGDLRRSRLRGRRGAGHRVRRLQLHPAEHPADHPARQMHDTFYVKAAAGADGAVPVLRTHTSPVQIRTMLSQKPPIRVVIPGRTYRCDSDQTHTPMFHQVEGLVIDESTHMGHLKWVLEEFCKAFFEVPSVTMRFRASHFPFTPNLGGSGHPVRPLRRRGEVRAGLGLAGDPGLRDGAPEGDRQLRPRSRPLPGLRVRLRHRSPRDAEIRRAGPARVLRRRPALAPALRLPPRSTGPISRWGSRDERRRDRGPAALVVRGLACHGGRAARARPIGGQDRHLRLARGLRRRAVVADSARDRSVVLDGAGRPACVLETVDVSRCAASTMSTRASRATKARATCPSAGGATRTGATSNATADGRRT